MRKQIGIFLLVSVVAAFSAGCSIRKSNLRAFEVTRSYYQAWMLNDLEKGTHIFIELTKVGTGVTFDSLIFRGQQVPVFETREGQTVTLKGMINVGVSKLPMKNKAVGKPDQLLYWYQGERHSFPLENIERRDMQYFQKQN